MYIYKYIPARSAVGHQNLPTFTPGSIQPHGFILICSEELKIIGASDNTSGFINTEASELIGKNICEVFGKNISEYLLLHYGDNIEIPNISLRHTNLSPNSRLQIISHRNTDGLIILEFEIIASNEKDVDFFNEVIEESFPLIQNVKTSKELFRIAALAFRKITDYDRAFVILFDEEYNGEVVGESKLKQIRNSYLGLQLPFISMLNESMSLSYLNIVQRISDTLIKPSSIITDDSHNASSIDLVNSYLKSVPSPYLEYLASLGVRSSLKVSLIHEQKLWGMVVCRNNTPKNLSFHLKAFSMVLSNMISLQYNYIREKEETCFINTNRDLQHKLMSNITDESSLCSGLTDFSPNVSNLIECCGVTICYKGEIHNLGHTPSGSSIEKLKEIIPLISGMNGNLFYTESIQRDLPEAEFVKSNICGIIACRIGNNKHDIIIWYRKELKRIINWALLPKKSNNAITYVQNAFDKKLEIKEELVKHHSKKWSKKEIAAITSFKNLLYEITEQRFATLNSINSEFQKISLEGDDVSLMEVTGTL